MKDELIAEQKLLNGQIAQINSRLREIHAALTAIEKEEAEEALLRLRATATHTAVKVSRSNRGEPYGREAYVRETPKGWRDVSDGIVYKKSNDTTKSEERKTGSRYYAQYAKLVDIKKREDI
jgi:hypothetical protein